MANEVQYLRKPRYHSRPARLWAAAAALRAAPAPQQPYAVLSFYNKEVYEKAGITKAPATWDEFSLGETVS
ncbi:hypothetical protein [Paenibacillus sp. Marseille-Q9583]